MTGPTALVAMIFLMAQPVAATSGRPQSVSPGRQDAFGSIESRCPTFSWGGLPNAGQVELVAYEVDPEDAAAVLPEPALRVVLPGSVQTWTPDLDGCFTRGARYAWFVRGRYGDESGEWSSARLFSVSTAPDREDLERALQVIRDYRDAHETVAAASEGGDDRAEAGVEDGAEGEVAEEPERSGGTRREVSLAAAPPLSSVALSVDDHIQVQGTSRPTLRLETAALTQAWDLIGSEKGFFVIDPNANTQPFHVGSGAPDDSLVVTAAGDVAAQGSVEASSFSGDGSSLTGVVATDAALLDGLDSTAFLRSDASDSFTSGTLSFGAGTQLQLPSDPASISGGGAGSGLDADTLDGLSSADLVAAADLQEHLIQDHVKVVFATSTQYTGALGGLSGADDKCAGHARVGDLRGVFKAWISGDSDSDEARDRLRTSWPGNYVLPSGYVVANGWSDLIDGTLDYAIKEDETGSLIGSGPVWTNTEQDGAKTSATVCGSSGTPWTSSNSGFTGWYGLSGVVASGWTHSSFQGCDVMARLYCIEQ